MKNQPTSEQVLIPDYMEYFGLEVDPFESVCPAFFEEGMRGDQFSQLLHLVQFSDAVLSVVGHAGLGKKTFRRELVQRLASEDVVVAIKAPLLNDSYDLLCEIVEKFGLDLPEVMKSSNDAEEGVNELVQLLREYGGERIESDALKILIIEDAHHLNAQALKALANVSLQQLENNRSIHLVMFGEPELSDRLVDLENQQLLVQIFELEPFSKEELKHYLRFRLDVVGFEGIFPYKPEDIDFLWEMSRGVPSDVHDAARDILIELASPPPESKSMGLPIPHMALIVFLLAGLLAALFYQSNISVETETSVSAVAKKEGNAKPNTFQENDPKDDSFEQVIPKTMSSQNIDSGDTLSLKTEQQKEGATSSLSTSVDSTVRLGPPPAGLKGVKEIDFPTTSDKKITQEKERLNEVVTVSKPVPVKTEEASKPGLTLKSETKQKDEKVLLDEDALIAQASRSKITRDESRLMSLSDELLTLQLLAGGSLEAAESFVDRQPNKKDLAIYSALRNGKTFYIVVAGSYQTSLQARDSIRSLPGEQQKAGPWPRTLSSVKEDIRKYRGL